MPYLVQPGDTLFKIARRFGVSSNEIIAANPQITDPNMIFPGQVIIIPVPGVPPAPFPGRIYIVQPGDTMFLIARRFGLRVDDLIAANPQIPDPDQINPGQILFIPTNGVPLPTPPIPTSPAPSPHPGRTYIVRPGDTMASIARRFGVSLDELIAANPQLDDPNLIFPGQVINIP